MRAVSLEYSLADFFEQPVLTLAMMRRGFDRRALDLMLWLESCTERRRPPVWSAPRIDEFIAE
jgi:hypothetical protein